MNLSGMFCNTIFWICHEYIRNILQENFSHNCQAQLKLQQSLAELALLAVDPAAHPPTPAGIVELGKGSHKKTTKLWTLSKTPID